MGKRRTNIGLSVATILVCIVLLEAVSGYMYEHLPHRFDNGRRLVDVYLGRTPEIAESISAHPYLLYQNVPDFNALGFRQHNSLGYRGPEFKVHKKQGTHRVLAIGGSTTHMYPFVENPDDTWVAQLQSSLKENTKPEIEVINAGLPYATSAELLSSYIFRHQYLNPDVLIIHTGGNDIAALMFENYDLEYTHFRAHGSGVIPRRFEGPLLKTSRFMRLIYAYWLNTFPTVYKSQPYPFSKVDRQEALERVRQNESEAFKRNLETLIQFAQSQNVKVVLFGYLQAREENISKKRKDLEGLERAWVEGLQKHYRLMRDLSEQYAVPFIIPDQDKFEDEWFSDNCHLNEEGEAVKAAVLYEHFTDSADWYFGGSDTTANDQINR